jgi:hypothetical protein
MQFVYRSGLCAIFLWMGLAPAFAADFAVTEDPQRPPTFAAPSAPGSADPALPAGESRLQLSHRNALIIGGAAALYGAYGRAKWWQDGFDSFKTTREGWFSKGTRYGGADKLGHMYSNYGTVRLLTPLFEYAGNSHDASVRLAAFTAVGIYTGIEMADGFSRKWRFSREDAIMNIAGTVLGAAMETYPELDRMIDFRVDYRPSGNRFDPFGDYSGQKYLLVVKADAFAPLRKNQFTRYLEVGVGYGARGFDPGEQRRRDAYIGVSLNLSRLLADAGYGGQMHTTPFQRATDRVFDLVQFPTVGYGRRSLD